MRGRRTAATRAHRAIVALLCVVALAGLWPPSTTRAAPIPVCGDITGPETWDITESPVSVFCTITIRPGGSLTIDPRVEVQMSPGVSIFVEGSLTAVGSPGNLITIGLPPASLGLWETIQFNVTGTGRVAFTQLSHGNRTLAAVGSSPRLDNNTVNTAAVGVHLRSSQATVENTSISDTYYGVFAESSAARIWFSDIDRTRFGIFAVGGPSVWIANNAVTNALGPPGGNASGPGGRGGEGGVAIGILATGVEDVRITGNTVTGVRGGSGGRGAPNGGGPGGAGGTGGDGVGIAVGTARTATVDSNGVALVRGGRGGNGANGSTSGGPGGDGGFAYPIEVLDIATSTFVNGNIVEDALGGSGGDGGPGTAGNRNGAGGQGRDAAGIIAWGSSNMIAWSNTIGELRGGSGGNSSFGAGTTPGPGGGGGDASGLFGLGVLGFHDYEFNSLVSLSGGPGGRGRYGGYGGNVTGLAALGNPKFANTTTLVGNFVYGLTGGAGALGTITGGPGGSAGGEAGFGVVLALSGDQVQQIAGGPGGAGASQGGSGGSATAFLAYDVPDGTAASFGVSGVTPGSPGLGGAPAPAIAAGVYALGEGSVHTAITFVNATIGGVSPGGFDFAVDPYAEVIALNASWDPAKLSVSPAGNLTIQNFLELVALWPDAATPVPGARFVVRDNGVDLHNVTADGTGRAQWLVVTDRRYIGSTTPTENVTTASASYPSQTFANSPRAVDMSTSHAEVFVMNDAEAPTSTLGTLPIYTSTVIVSVAFSSSDGTGVGVQNVTLYYSRSGGAWTSYMTIQAASGTFPFDSSATGGDGVYAFTSVAVDLAGNVEPGPGANKTWTQVDTTRPRSHVEPLPTYETTLSFLVSWGPDEDVTDIAFYTIQVRDNGGAWIKWFEDTTLRSAMFSGQDGHTYEFRSMARDVAGNVEILPAGNDTWTIVDITGPRSSVANLTPYTTTTTFTISWAPGPGVTDIAAYTIEVSADGGPWTVLVNGTTGTSTAFTGIDGHRYAFRSIARDRAGNWETKTANDTWTHVDATPPTILSFSPSGSGVSTTSPIVITFSEPMDWDNTEAAITFTPALAGAFSWNANRTVVTFVAYSPMSPNTQYTVVVGSGAEDIADNNMVQRVFQFTTGAAVPGSNPILDFWWVFLIVAAGAIGAAVLAMRFLRPSGAAGTARKGAAAAMGDEHAIIEDVFLLYRDGVLIKHQTRRLKPDIDSDILTGMLTAVQAFVKDSFRGEAEGELDEMTFGELRIMIGRGKYVVLAAMVTGAETRSFKRQIQSCIREIEERHWDQLDDWNGDLAVARNLDPYLKKLIRGEYR